MSRNVAEVHAAPASETIDRTRLASRPLRLRESARWLSIRSAPVFFVAFAAVSLTAALLRDGGLPRHAVERLVSSALGALLASGVVFVAVCQASLLETRKTKALMRRGIPVSARLDGRPTGLGDVAGRHLPDGLLRALWLRIARSFGRNLPCFVVTYRYELQGETCTAREFFYADEEVAEDPDGLAWAIVDPEAPGRRSWLVRVQGSIQGDALGAPEGRQGA